MNAPLMIGEAFPANDVLARWVMVLSIARNDLALATERIVRANEDDDGTNMHWQRLLAAHFFEAGAVALRSGFTQQLPEQPRRVTGVPAHGAPVGPTQVREQLA